jgi:hypothetical protein
LRDLTWVLLVASKSESHTSLRVSHIILACVEYLIDGINQATFVISLFVRFLISIIRVDDWAMYGPTILHWWLENTNGCYHDIMRALKKDEMWQWYNTWIMNSILDFVGSLPTWFDPRRNGKEQRLILSQAQKIN